MSAPLARMQTSAAAAVRSVTLLGATGSIGASTVDLLKREGGRYRVEAVTAHRNAASLAQLARELCARFAAVADPQAYDELKQGLAGSGIEAGAGESGLMEAAQRPAEWVWPPSAAPRDCGRRSRLRSAAPRLRSPTRKVSSARAPCSCAARLRRALSSAVDLEHNAVFQALSAGRREDVRRVVLTASGGPFRTWPAAAIRTATPEQASRHPNWSMGVKITIDSATLMNKGLELIEAYHLFALAPTQIDVLIHPQSIVHGLVEFQDGSFIAQLGAPDMRIPIAHCLAWPDRIRARPHALFGETVLLRFEAPDPVRFRALRVARGP